MPRKHLWLTALAVLIFAPPLWAGEEYCDVSPCPCLFEMAEKLHQRGWVGIELDHNDDGTLTVKRVLPKSPAEAAGLEAGDVLLALEGVAYARADSEAMNRAYQAMVPENTITYTIRRAGQEREIGIELAPLPESIMAQWIGYAVLKQYAKQQKAEKAKAGAKVADSDGD